MNNAKAAAVRDFEADRKICDAATAGPWFAKSPYRLGHGFVMDGDNAVLAETSDINARFIAEARTGWPAALDRIAELEAELGLFDQRGEVIERQLAEIDELQRYGNQLEMMNSQLGYELADIVDESQRYRQALESISDTLAVSIATETTYPIITIIEEALAYDGN